MFFPGFNTHLKELDKELFPRLVEAVKQIDLDSLDREVTGKRYPAFNNMLGLSLYQVTQRGDYHNGHIGLELVDELVQAIEDLACLKDRQLYSMSLSIMQPKSFIDWHYDQHTRSMLCERIHIPVQTNEETTFYAKWFQDPQAYQYKMRPGEVYRFNNRVPHAVKNDGDLRIHLICDFIDTKVLRWYRETNKLFSLEQVELAPVRHHHLAWTFNHPEPEGVQPCATPYFNYTHRWVDIIGKHELTTSLSRSMWHAGQPDYIEVVENALDNQEAREAMGSDLRFQHYRYDPSACGLFNVPNVDYTKLLEGLSYPVCWFYDAYLRAWLPREVPAATLTEDEQHALGLLPSVVGRVNWQELQTRFKEQGVVYIPRLISPEYARYLSEVFHRHDQERWDYMGHKTRTSINNLPIVRLLHQQVERLIKYVVRPEPIKSSYSFTACYEAGSSLPRHTDRPQCVFNLSMMFDCTPEEGDVRQWPLNIEIGDKRHTVMLDRGDAVLYRGTKDPHWRDQMPDELQTVTGTFLHFVDADFKGSLD